MSFDLSELDTRKACDQGAVLDLRHPETGKPLDIKITLAGVDSKLYTQAANRIAAERANASMTPAKMKLARQGRPVLVTEADMQMQQEDAIKLLAAATLSWEGVLVAGKEIPCSYEEAISLYTNFPWIMAQVDAFVADRSNFLSGSLGS
jgi:hypothetical protein